MNRGNLKQIKPRTVVVKTKMENQHVKCIQFPKFKEGVTWEQMQDLVNIQIKEHKNKNLMFMPTVKLDRGFSTAKSFDVDSTDKCEMYIYSGDELNKVYGLYIFYWNKNNKKGGSSDIHNDCLFGCLAKAINIEEIRESYNMPSKFKRMLKLERDEKVSIDLLPKIEKALKININCMGDYSYISSHKNVKTVNLVLTNEHYKLAPVNISESMLLKGMSFKSQKMAYFFEKSKEVIIYDGKEISTIDFKEFAEEHKTQFGEYAFLKAESESTIEQEFMTHQEEAQKIYDESKGVIDYAKGGFTHTNVVKRLIYNYTKSIAAPEELSPLEEQFIKGFSGHLSFSNPCTLENAKCIDMNSAYASYLRSESFKIPMKQGDFVVLDELPEILTFGLYRCKIHRSDDPHINKLFLFGGAGHKYTHFDINTARTLGLKVELINDGAVNALLYGAGKCITACKVFRSMIDMLLGLKQKKVKYAKILLTRIWGAMCERRGKYKHLTEEFQIPDDWEITKAYPSNGTFTIKYTPVVGLFKYPYARIGPFITAVVRRKMALAMFPIRERVYRCLCDSFVTDVDLKDINVKISSNVGDFKIEKEGSKCIVKNSMHVEYFS